jgi:hypothetical protein
MVELLAMAHERGCESELADELATGLQDKQLPEMAAHGRASHPIRHGCRSSLCSLLRLTPMKTCSATA